jgi:hypothetical protein
MESGRPQNAIPRRELLLMAAVAVALRVLLFAVATASTGTGFSDYAGAADGYQYIAYARAWLGDSPEFDANPVFRRLFPGYPALIAVLHRLGIPLPAAALLPSWLACGAVAVLCALYFRDRRIGWAAATLTPSYVFSGSLICTEAMCLLLSLLGLFQLRRGRAGLAGLAFGLGGLFRPVAVFAMAGGAGDEALSGRPGRAAAVTAAAGATVAAGLAALGWRFGDALMTLRWNSQAYAGTILTWPFKSLVTTPLTTPVAAWKLAFVAVHLAAVLAGCALSIHWLRTASGDDRGLARISALWLCCNTLYVLCIGNVWGFHDFPRFLVPALPPLFWVWRRALPARLWIWVAVGLLSVALAVAPARRRLLEPPPRRFSAAAALAPIIPREPRP